MQLAGPMTALASDAKEKTGYATRRVQPRYLPAAARVSTHGAIEGDSMYGQGRELELGNATSAVLISLLRTLVDKDLLSNADVRVLLTKAASDLGPHEYAAPVKGAMGIIVNDLLPMFPEDGGD